MRDAVDSAMIQEPQGVCHVDSEIVERSIHRRAHPVKRGQMNHGVGAFIGHAGGTDVAAEIAAAGRETDPRAGSGRGR